MTPEQAVLGARGGHRRMLDALDREDTAVAESERTAVLSALVTADRLHDLAMHDLETARRLARNDGRAPLLRTSGR